jgi:hypothetical protein
MNEYDIPDDVPADLRRDLRYVVPESFLRSTAGCRVEYILTADNRLLDSHEREAIRAGARFTYFGSESAADLIGSRTTRGHLCSYMDAGRIVHGWTFEN